MSEEVRIPTQNPIRNQENTFRLLLTRNSLTGQFWLSLVFIMCLETNNTKKKTFLVNWTVICFIASRRGVQEKLAILIKTINQSL